jgi:hypothetical protein
MDERAPGRIVYRARELAVDHSTDVQVLVRDEIVLLAEEHRELSRVVLSPVTDEQVRLGDQALRAPSTVT